MPSRMPSPQIRPALLMARNTRLSVMAAAVVQASTADLTHSGMGTSGHDQIGDNLMVFSLLDRLEHERQEFASA